MPALILDFHAPLPKRLYWDASFLVHATYPASRYHQECYEFLDRLNGAEATRSYVSTLALDEAIFALVRLKVAEDHPDRGFWDVYRENPHVIQPHLPELRALVDRLYSGARIQVAGTEPGFVPRALNDMEDYALLPRDALHLATMSRYDVDHMVTIDADFLSVDGLRIYTCNPKILSQT